MTKVDPFLGGVPAAGESRRDLLALAYSSIATSQPAVIGSGREKRASIQPLAECVLRRSRDNRCLSRQRYQGAECFLKILEQGPALSPRDALYQAGIVAQLALGSHLLDVGVSDEWCRVHIGLRIEDALALANRTGLAFECPDMARLARLLTPYSRWRAPVAQHDSPAIDDAFSASQLSSLLRALLDEVRQVTGHPRPPARRSTLQA